MVLQEQIDSSKWRSLEGLDVAHMLERRASREPDKALMVWSPSRVRLGNGPISASQRKRDGLPGASQIAGETRRFRDPAPGK